MPLRVVPLGGLGEIGLNAMVVEVDDRRLLIDCGLLFPRLTRGLGFEIYVPDLAYLRRDWSSLDGVVLTHGHEDHLGALPLLLQEKKIPVWGGRFSLALLSSRLAELGIDADLRPMSAGDRFSVGAFDVEPVHVNHSIPDATGLIVRTAEGIVVHSGDFKIDPEPFGGRHTDLAAYARAGSEGVACLLSDSTNAERPGVTASEQEVARTLDTLIANSTGRVIITQFASHLIRLQQVIELAAKYGRKLIPLGRSLVGNLRLGSELGHLVGSGAVAVGVEALPHLPDREVLMVVSGAQGEAQSALARMADDPQAPAHIRAGDTVIFCARAIPGNEVPIQNLINRLWELGATVITDDNHGAPGLVHTSGHASQDEQLQLINAVHPATFVPIHGEARQLARHIRVARESEAAPQCVLARDGDIVDLGEPGSAHVAGRAPFGRIALERRGGSVVPPSAIQARAALAEGGVVNVVLLVERASGQLLRGPELSGVGLVDSGALLVRAREVVRDELASLSDYARRDPEQLRDAASRAVVRSFRRDGERRPVVHPIVVEL